MNGSKIVSMTLAEMRARRESGNSTSDFEAIRRNAMAGTEPADDEDSPDASETMRAEVKRLRGRPAGSDKTQIALRVDNDTLATFRSTGRGWQSRMNAALRDWLKTHSPV